MEQDFSRALVQQVGASSGSLPGWLELWREWLNLTVAPVFSEDLAKRRFLYAEPSQFCFLQLLLVSSFGRCSHFICFLYDSAAVQLGLNCFKYFIYFFHSIPFFTWVLVGAIIITVQLVTVDLLCRVEFVVAAYRRLACDVNFISSKHLFIMRAWHIFRMKLHIRQAHHIAFAIFWCLPLEPNRLARCITVVACSTARSFI